MTRCLYYNFEGEPPVSCGFLPYPSNGRVALTGVTVGSTAFYACNAGFLLVGDERRTCQSNGQWSGSEPRCFRKKIKYVAPSNISWNNFRCRLPWVVTVE